MLNSFTNVSNNLQETDLFIRLEHHRKMKCWTIKKSEGPYPNLKPWSCYIFIWGLTESHCCLSPSLPSTTGLSWDSIKLEYMLYQYPWVWPQVLIFTVPIFLIQFLGFKINNIPAFHAVFVFFKMILFLLAK